MLISVGEVISSFEFDVPRRRPAFHQEKATRFDVPFCYYNHFKKATDLQLSWALETLLLSTIQACIVWLGETYNLCKKYAQEHFSDFNYLRFPLNVLWQFISSYVPWDRNPPIDCRSLSLFNASWNFSFNACHLRECNSLFSIFWYSGSEENEVAITTLFKKRTKPMSKDFKN